MIKHVDITGSQGTPLRAVFIPVGEAPNYPPDNEKGYTEDLVEFYDRSHDFTPDGQFITCYYASTLLGRPTGSGLDLMGYVPDWKIDGRTLQLVLDWIAYHQYVKP
jgi:hypothetical protein